MYPSDSFVPRRKRADYTLVVFGAVTLFETPTRRLATIGHKTMTRRTIVNTLPPRNNPLTKDELLNGLNNVLNNFLYGFVCPNLIPTEVWKDASNKIVVFAGRDRDVEVNLGPLTRHAFNADYSPREGFKRNYENSLLRALLRESHELILWYCEETNQFPAYKAEPWFQFARILRNVISHKEGGTLRAWPKDLTAKGITSVTWHGRTIDTTMLSHRFVFYPPEGLELVKDQVEFVTAKLS
jgi:hypothetical protein